MPKVVDHVMIPDHTPILVCPNCTRHTPHVMPEEGTYQCLVCETTHGRAPKRNVHEEEPTPIWCERCQQPKGSPFWAPVNGRRQCRVCLGWMMVVQENAVEEA